VVDGSDVTGPALVWATRQTRGAEKARSGLSDNISPDWISLSNERSAGSRLVAMQALSASQPCITNVCSKFLCQATYTLVSWCAFMSLALTTCLRFVSGTPPIIRFLSAFQILTNNSSPNLFGVKADAEASAKSAVVPSCEK